MPSQIQIYGNAPSGDHNALCRNINDAFFPGRGPRTIVGFLILNAEGTAPLDAPGGEPYFAVAVCNPSKGVSPQSKQFKIRKAMLRADEFDAIDNALSVPGWEHFLQRLPDGSRRVVKARVVQKPTSDGRFVSEITAIQRPRDGQWESIVGKFGGGPPYRPPAPVPYSPNPPPVDQSPIM